MENTVQNTVGLLPFPAHPNQPASIEAAVELVTSGRRARHVELVLAALRTGHKTNRELAKITARYGARVHDLRKLGHVIRTVQLGQGVVEYRMVWEGKP